MMSFLYRPAVCEIGPVFRSRQTARGLISANDSSCNIVGRHTDVIGDVAVVSIAASLGDRAKMAFIVVSW